MLMDVVKQLFILVGASIMADFKDVLDNLSVVFIVICEAIVDVPQEKGIGL